MNNPDRALLLRYASTPEDVSRVDSNALAIALNMRIVALDPNAGKISLFYTPGDMFIQGAGFVQGGAVSAMLDFAMAFAGLSMLEPEWSAGTVNLNTAFLRPARAGSFTAEGWIDRRGRSLLFAGARLLDAEGSLTATASSTLCVVPNS